jgi:hypothetical protein
MQLFKFRSTTKYSIEGLINNELYFSSFKEFNDPFEFSNPVSDLATFNKNGRKKLKELFKNKELIKKDYQHLLSLLKEPTKVAINERNKTLDRITKSLPNIGVFCLSEINNSILMWSHYANDHKGFCIEFNNLNEHLDINQDLIKIKYLDEFEDLNNPDLLINFYIIMFCDSKHLNNEEWKKKYMELGNLLNKHEESELAKTVMGNKYIDWAYEKEVRLVGKAQGLIRYDPKSIESITFGLRMSKSDKSTIKNLCQTPDKSHIKFKQADKSDSKFTIEIVDLPDQ